jgi:hypothetical protein
MRALELLNYLGAIDDDGQMTEVCVDACASACRQLPPTHMRAGACWRLGSSCEPAGMTCRLGQPLSFLVLTVVICCVLCAVPPCRSGS